MYFEYFALTRRMDPEQVLLNSRTVFTAGPSFPADMVEEVISRVDAKQLCTFKLLNKDYTNLITSKSFMDKHFDHMKELNNAIFVFQEESVFGALYYHVNEIDEAHNGRLVTEDDNEIKIVGSSGGMILFCNKNDEFYLYNPVNTQKYNIPTCKIVFPDGGTSAKVFFGLGYESVEDDYKIIRIAVFDTVKEESEVMVYSRNTGKWGRISNFPGDTPVCQSSVQVCGRLHWRSSKKEGGYYVTSYELTTGAYGRFNMPDVHPITGFHHLVALDSETLGSATGKVHTDPTHTMWILMDYQDDSSWYKLDIDFTSLVEPNLSCVQPLCFIKPGRERILIRINPSGDFVIYDMVNKSFMNVGAKDIGGGYMTPFQFYPTLHSPSPVFY